MKNLTDLWNKEANDLLLNKKIIKVEYMHSEEAEDSMWHNRAVRLILEDGTEIEVTSKYNFSKNEPPYGCKEYYDLYPQYKESV